MTTKAMLMPRSCLVSMSAIFSASDTGVFTGPDQSYSSFLITVIKSLS